MAETATAEKKWIPFKIGFDDFPTHIEWESWVKRGGYHLNLGGTDVFETFDEFYKGVFLLAFPSYVTPMFGFGDMATNKTLRRWAEENGIDPSVPGY